MRSRCVHPGQQHGRRCPSSSSSWVRRIRRSRVMACLAPSTQQMNSLRARDVMSFQAPSAVGFAISAFRRSAGSLCTTPPGTWPLTSVRVAVLGELVSTSQAALTTDSGIRRNRAATGAGPSRPVQTNVPRAGQRFTHAWLLDGFVAVNVKDVSPGARAWREVVRSGLFVDTPIADGRRRASGRLESPPIGTDVDRSDVGLPLRDRGPCGPLGVRRAPVQGEKTGSAGRNARAGCNEPSTRPHEISPPPRVSASQ